MRNYTYIMEYLPKRYSATTKQENDRHVIYDFKDGNLSDEVKNGFLEKLNSITKGDKATWSICFIPASTKNKTIIRYGKLAKALEAEGYNVGMDTIHNEHDKEAEHILGKTNNPMEGFGFSANGIAGKKVIIIDDIITRGTTFNQAAMKLQELGATTVTGLFLAKTINPDYNPQFSEIDDNPIDYYEDECDPIDCYEDDYDYYEEERTYECYNGSYAQDVEGWSDQDIDIVFDGDPDAYWNID